jgi:hypothetical protein
MASGVNSVVTGTSFNTHIAPGEEENADSPYMQPQHRAVYDARPATERYPVKPSNTTAATTAHTAATAAIIAAAGASSATASSAAKRAAAAVSTPAALAAGFARAQHSVRAGDSSDTVALPALIPLPAALTGAYTTTICYTIQYSLRLRVCYDYSYAYKRCAYML